ncbi:hypothetical protein BpHYR1_033249 [Brachionus plicatilis]|uniref:Uncharacterized protein n=1 Tax=Brachionus plicatilis TaxID=10195 RepID=A0A3M7PIW7_BRAPC|nr:hypothetical protein BpHYR1_033249 [Brachionus plicatilis]
MVLLYGWVVDIRMLFLFVTQALMKGLYNMWCSGFRNFRNFTLLNPKILVRLEGKKRSFDNDEEIDGDKDKVTDPDIINYYIRIRAIKGKIKEKISELNFGPKKNNQHN